MNTAHINGAKSRARRLACLLLLSCLSAQLLAASRVVGARQDAQEEKRGPAAQVGKTAGEGARVIDAVLGVGVGMTLEEAHAKLKDLGTVGGRATRDGGRKEAWTLKKTEFSAIAYQTDGGGRVKWVTGFVRPGKELPFAKLGDLARAIRKSEQTAVWNVERAEGNYRLMATGAKGKASVIQLIQLALPPR